MRRCSCVSQGSGKARQLPLTSKNAAKTGLPDGYLPFLIWVASDFVLRGEGREARLVCETSEGHC